MKPRNAELDADMILAHLDWVRGLAHGLVSDSSLADDVVQETWLAALRHPPSPHRPPRPWLLSVVRNAVHQIRRGEAVRRGHEAGASKTDTLPSAGELVEKASLQRTVVDVLLALDEPYRRTILLRYFEGLTPEAIARRTGTPAATVKTRLSRGLAKLRELLDTAHGGDRRTWALALAPLAVRPPWSGPLVLEALLVSTTLKVTLGVSAVALGAVAWIQLQDGEPVAPSQSPALVATPPAELIEPGAPTEAVDSAPAERTEVVSIAPTPEEAVADEHSIRARVVDLANQPVGGVEIGLRLVNGSRSEEDGTSPLWKEDLPLGQPPVAISGADGRFALTVEGYRGALVSQDERWETLLAPPAREGDEEAAVVVAPCFSLRGQVRDESGAPVDGARLVFLMPANFMLHLDSTIPAHRNWWSATTDSEGAFTLPRLPAVEGALLRVRNEGFPTLDVLRPAWSDETLDIVLEQPTGWLEGLVRDPSGQPLPGAFVALGYRGVETTDEGRFRLSLEGITDATMIRAAAPGFLPASLEGFAPEEGGSVRWPAFVEIGLREEALALAGRIVDADGDGVSGFEVLISDPDPLYADGLLPVQVETILAGSPGATVRTETDEQGHFAFAGLQRRDYHLRAVDPETALVLEAGPLPAGTRDARIVVPEDALWPEVRGRVVTRGGEPVAGATLSISRVKEMIGAPGGNRYFRVDARGARATSDEDGAFVLSGVPREGTTLSCHGPRVASLRRQLDRDTNVENLLLVVNLEVQLRLRLADPSEADGFALLNAAGERLDMMFDTSRGLMRMNYAGLTDGLSPVVTASDDAAVLVLFHSGTEGRGIPVLLSAEGINEIDL